MLQAIRVFSISLHSTLEMERWEGKIAVVTGASSGIGETISKELAKIGLIVIGLARRPEKIEEYAKESSGKIFAFKCDVSDPDSIKDAFKWIEEKFGFIHILINNAGQIKNIKLLGESSISDEVSDIINTNFTGLVICTNEAFRLIKKSDDYGMIININSTAGHRVFFPPNGLSYNVYPGTKHAVTATSEVLRQELIHQKNDKVRVTSISPGVVATEIFTAFGKEYSENFLRNAPSIKPEDVANAVLYLLTTPYYLSITELSLKHQFQPY